MLWFEEDSYLNLTIRIAKQVETLSSHMRLRPHQINQSHPCKRLHWVAPSIERASEIMINFYTLQEHVP